MIRFVVYGCKRSDLSGSGFRGSGGGGVRERGREARDYLIAIVCASIIGLDSDIIIIR